ncbi:MAG: hypothetical protein IPJ14_04990 [Kineosporiaceae bacterium]|nr:hypothetical protein [Kineosporiaceae bacterium]MBK7622015.1 hypothetical protein [Kineosporiaceae bacterium]
MEYAEPDDPQLALHDQLERAWRADLLAGRPFPVFGLAEPRLTPAMLTEFGTSDGLWERVTLSFGDYLSVSGPYLEVTTVNSAELSSPLEDAVEAELDRVGESAEVDEPGSTAVTGPEPGELWVADIREPAHLVQGPHHTWAARATVAGVTLCVTGRGITLDDVHLVTVDDLAPYLEARDAEWARVREAGPGPSSSPEDWDLPPVEGLAAHESLLRLLIADSVDRQATIRSGRRPRASSRQGEDHARLWEQATRAQMRLASQPRRAADRSVTAMVNQATTLAELAAWFTGEELRARAVTEMIRFTVFDSDVPSRTAQLAWLAAWSARSGQPPPDDVAGLRDWVTTLAVTQDDALAAWQRWADAPAGASG